jgi:Arc/MetJ family transcription regulator
VQTNIAIDDTLISQALKATGLKSEKEVVEIALKELISQSQKDRLAAAFGKFRWEGDLDAMRTDK